MKKLKIACLFGGNSSEYAISLVSATSVIRAIDKNKYDLFMIGITKDGNFYLYEGDIDKIEKDEWFESAHIKRITWSTNREDHGFIILDNKDYSIISIDLTFPILHGINGEDGRLQGLFELAGIKYIGCDLMSSAIGMDKFLAHELVRLNGLLVPKSYKFTSDTSYEKIVSTINDLGYPLFVKPLRAGSSLGVSKVNDDSELSNALTLAFNYDNQIIIEENIEGFEVGCAILGNDNLITGEVDEIEISSGFFDYEKKYESKDSKVYLPARISSSERERVKQVALQIYNILGCKDLARIDMFYTKNKEIIFNEVNTFPGFTSHSRFPNMLKQKNYTFEQIVEMLIELKR